MSVNETAPPVSVRRWPTERPLLILNALASAGFWFLFFRSLLTAPLILAYAAIAALMNVVLITALRGSAVRLGPEQFPELYGRVEEIARRFGMRRMPEVYLKQQDGALNAFATRFIRTHMVVLFSDLLEACGDNAAARDMIIGHELGHIRAGHLRGRWLLMPASLVPFLGSALSRAREYTCDRYGMAAAGEVDGALLGLAILAAGGKYGPLVNRAHLSAQRLDLRGSWLLLGEWLGSHPPLSKRVFALAPDLESGSVGTSRVRSALLPLRVAAAAVIVVVAAGAAVSAYLPRLGMNRANASASQPKRPDAERQVGADLAGLKTFIEDERKHGRALPWDIWDLYARWERAHPGEKAPLDPFSGYWYDYETHGSAYRVWSTGPDGRTNTADDIVLESAKGALPHRRYVKAN